MFKAPRAGIQKEPLALHLHTLNSRPLPSFHPWAPGGWERGPVCRSVDAPTLKFLLGPHSWHVATLLPLLELKDKGYGKEATQALAAGSGLLVQGIPVSWVGVWSSRELEPRMGTTLWTFEFFTLCKRGPKWHLKWGAQGRFLGVSK